MSNSKTIKETIHASGIDITIYTNDYKTEYISLTDIARFRSTDPRFTIHSWLRSRDIVEFLGLWECLYNPVFNRVDFDTFKRDAGTNAYAFSIKERLILLRNMVEQQMKTLVGLGLGTERLLLK